MLHVSCWGRSETHNMICLFCVLYVLFVCCVGVGWISLSFGVFWCYVCSSFSVPVCLFLGPNVCS